MTSETLSTAGVTSAEAWRKPAKEGEVKELPSGNFARLRRTIDLTTMLRAGQIPNPLASVLLKALNQRGQVASTDFEGLDEQQFTQMMDLVDSTCASSFIEPRVEIPGKDVDPAKQDPPEGAIWATDIDIRDRMWVFQYAQGAALDLALFRQQPTPDVATLQDVEGVPSPPKQPRKRK